jgi:broad specificity phosphatase PhoE
MCGVSFSWPTPSTWNDTHEAASPPPAPRRSGLLPGGATCSPRRGGPHRKGPSPSGGRGGAPARGSPGPRRPLGAQEDAGDRRDRAQGPLCTLEAWPEFQEIRPGRLKDLEDPKEAFLKAFFPRDPSDRFLGGERYGDFLDRVLAAYARLLAQPWDTLLLVAHGGVIRAILSYALTGKPILLPLEVHPCGLSVLDMDEERAFLRLHNLTPYELLPQERRTTMEALWEAYRWEGRDRWQRTQEG